MEVLGSQRRMRGALAAACQDREARGVFHLGKGFGKGALRDAELACGIGDRSGFGCFHKIAELLNGDSVVRGAHGSSWCMCFSWLVSSLSSCGIYLIGLTDCIGKLTLILLTNRESRIGKAYIGKHDGDVHNFGCIA